MIWDPFNYCSCYPWHGASSIYPYFINVQKQVASPLQMKKQVATPFPVPTATGNRFNIGHPRNDLKVHIDTC
jgi:hypothetical protein